MILLKETFLTQKRKLELSYFSVNENFKEFILILEKKSGWNIEITNENIVLFQVLLYLQNKKHVQSSIVDIYLGRSN